MRGRSWLTPRQGFLNHGCGEVRRGQCVVRRAQYAVVVGCVCGVRGVLKRAQSAVGRA